MVNFSKSSAPGAWIVDFVPLYPVNQCNICRNRHMAPDFSELQQNDQIVWDTTWEPYLWSKKNVTKFTMGILSGDALLPNLCATVLEEADRNTSTEHEDHLVWAASAVMGAGMDTASLSVQSQPLSELMKPDRTPKARKEIDDVVGQDRLPTIQDKAALPYVRSVMTEVLRWNPAVPLEEFNPDRYNNLDSEMEQVADLVFGFGRRVCPGKHFAEGTFFAIVATVLATFPVVDAKGKEVIPNITFSTGTIIFPSAFDLNLKCQSQKALDLLAGESTDEQK
ncbi:cytochrome P450 [Mycena epipterygia]|nr:cytochrome P450 [Mycena epipterygia]